MRPCPYCAETIEDQAQVCPFCNTNLAALASASGFQSTPPLGNRETSGKAIASLICGILFFFLPSAIVAIIMGHLSLSDIRRSAGRLGGRGMAIAGLVLGYTGLAIIPVLIIAAIAIPNLLRARMAANEASAVGSLRTINTACVTYGTEYKSFPTSLANLGPGAHSNANAAGLITFRRKIECSKRTNRLHRPCTSACMFNFCRSTRLRRESWRAQLQARFTARQRPI